MDSLFDEYIKVSNCEGVSPDDLGHFTFGSVDQSKDEYHSILINELSKINFYLYDEPLKIVENGHEFLFINSKGYLLGFVGNYYQKPLVKHDFIVYSKKELEYYPKDKDFGLELLLPLQFYEHLRFELNGSRIEVSTFSNYFIDVLKSLNSISLFEKYFNEMLKFNSDNYFFKYNSNDLYYSLLKKNYNIKLIEIIKELFDKKIISFLEYIVCIELGYLNYDKDTILHIIFNSKKIDSFISKKSNEIPLSETSQKILNNTDLIIELSSLISTKNDFYNLFDLISFVNTIRFEFLKEEINYKKVFDYHQFSIIKLTDSKKIINSLIPEHINYRFDEVSDRFIHRTGRNFFSNEDKKKFILSYVTNSIDNKIIKKKINLIIRDFENKIRITRGYKVVGTFTNESILYVKLKEYFTDYKVISQGRPEWLGRQSLDIYFPEYNIGIEYQGVQHFKPIEYFGGQSTFLKRMELDELKKRLCKNNNCHLIEVLPDYNLNDVISDIELTIKSRSENMIK
jgi:hypothetical protein